MNVSLSKTLGRLYDGQSYCKKLWTDGTKTELRSLNPAYKPIHVCADAPFRIFGVVVG